MGACILVTVDLHEKETQKRREFDDRMSGRGWSRFENVAGAYLYEFDGEALPLEAAVIAAKHVEDSASEAGVAAWDAVCLPSSSRPLLI